MTPLNADNVQANDLHRIFATHRPVIDDRPDLVALLGSERRGSDPLPRRSFILWFGTYGVVGIAAWTALYFACRFLVSVLP